MGGTRVGPTASAAIWLAGLAAFGWAVAVSVTGGFVVTVTGVAISSHRIVPPYLLGVALLFASPSARAFLRSFSNSTAFPRAPGALGMATAVVTFVAGLLFGTFTAVGDAFGYISQADLWLKAQLFQSQGPALAMSWSDAAWAFCPLGFRPGVVSGTMVPTYAPGLPLLMAALKTAIGENGVYFVDVRRRTRYCDSSGISTSMASRSQLAVSIGARLSFARPRLLALALITMPTAKS